MLQMEILHSVVASVSNTHAHGPSIHPFLMYIDPASGQLLLQMLIAALIGFLVSFRKAVIALASKFSRAKKSRRPNVN